MNNDKKYSLLKAHLTCSGIKFTLDECLLSNLGNELNCRQQVKDFFDCAKKFDKQFREKYECKK